MPEDSPTTPEQKIAILRRHLVDGVPVTSLGDLHRIDASTIQRWVSQLFASALRGFQGEDAPVEAEPSTSPEDRFIEPEYRIHILRQYLVERLPLPSVCALHRISAATLNQWENQFFEAGLRELRAQDPQLSTEVALRNQEDTLRAMLYREQRKVEELQIMLSRETTERIETRKLLLKSYAELDQRVAVKTEKLRSYGKELEMLVSERTSELQRMNEQLCREIVERELVQSQLEALTHALQEKNDDLERHKVELMQLAEELSTPLLQPGKGMLLAPLIGSMDDRRTANTMRRILDAVTSTCARYLILDVTGLARIDVSTAAHFLRIIQATRLLGAETILAGIQPQVAKSIVALGLDLSSVVTVSSLADALRRCSS